jgi:hypothetical protein
MKHVSYDDDMRWLRRTIWILLMFLTVVSLCCKNARADSTEINLGGITYHPFFDNDSTQNSNKLSADGITSSKA